MLCDIFSGRDAVAQRDIDRRQRPAEAVLLFLPRRLGPLPQRPGRRQPAYRAGQQAVQAEHNVALRRRPVGNPALRPEEATFTAKNGQYYEKARISLEEDGLRVSAHGEWKTIPIDQLPDDLSPFPTDLRDQIARRRTVASLGTAAKPVTPITFTTTTGKTYNQVRWKMEDSAVDILTDNGWVPVPLNSSRPICPPSRPSCARRSPGAAPAWSRRPARPRTRRPCPSLSPRPRARPIARCAGRWTDGTSTY